MSKQRKLLAAVAAMSMIVSAAAPTAVLAAKDAPALTVETNFGSNDFENGANGNPWINKVSDKTPITLDAYPEHGNVQCIDYTSINVATLTNYNTTFNTYYQVGGGAYAPLYDKYSLSFDFMLPQNNVVYKFILQDRGAGAAKGIKSDGEEIDISYLAEIDFLANGKIGLYKNGVSTWPVSTEENYCTFAYNANQWYRMRIDADTDNCSISLYIDNNFIGSFNWDEYYKQTYESYSGILGLISTIIIQGGIGHGFVPEGTQDTSGYKLYFDNLSMDYIVEGSFYGKGAIDGDTVTVTLSETPYNLTAEKLSSITVKKSDGSAASTGGITLSGKTITIPLTGRDGGAEYVVNLPEDLIDINGNKVYSPQIYISSPILSSDKEYLINDDFEGDIYNWAKSGNDKLPQNAVANTYDFQTVTTAYKNADGTVSDSAVDGANKVLKMKKTGTAATGMYFNFPSPAVSDFTVEFDFMTDFIATGGTNLQITANQGKIVGDISANGDPTPQYTDYEDNASYSYAQQMVFGFTKGSSGVKFGAPFYKSLDTGSGRYWSTDPGSGDAYENTQIEIEANKWYKIKLDFKLTGKAYNTAVINAVVNDGTQDILNAEIPTSINLFTPGESGLQIQSLGFKTAWNAGAYTKDGAEAYYPLSYYFDNLKVYSYNRTDNRVKTVTLTDTENNEFGAVSAASDSITSIRAELAAEKNIIASTVSRESVHIKDSDGNDVDFTLGEYDAENKTFDITLNKFLERGKTYYLTIDGIYAKNSSKLWGTSSKAGTYIKLPKYTAQINVSDAGVPEIKTVLKFVDSDGAEVTSTDGASQVYLQAEVKSTLNDNVSVTPIIGAYNDLRIENVLIGSPISVEGRTYKTYKSAEAFDLNSETAAMLKGMLWYNTDNLKPLSEVITLPNGRN
ncbi:MAG: hypothetical protein ACI4DY_04510 [Monoglobaceae bacterium]